jgi:hypothetical protein
MYSFRSPRGPVAALVPPLWTVGRADLARRQAHPIHAAVTRFLAPHEYGHHVE